MNDSKRKCAVCNVSVSEGEFIKVSRLVITSMRDKALDNLVWCLDCVHLYSVVQYRESWPRRLWSIIKGAFS